MCLITIAPKGPESLDWDTLVYSYKQMNSDGFGIAWYDWDKEAWNSSRSMRSHRLYAAISSLVPSESPLVIHQRFRTHGSRSMENVHPFHVGESGLLLFHNGTIRETRADYRNATISDTRAYIEDELAPIIKVGGNKLLEHRKFLNAVGRRVGGSVLAITAPGNPDPFIVNEYLGDWEKDVYYSNSYSRPKAYTPYAMYGGADEYYGNYGRYKPSKYLSEKYGWEWEDDDPNAPVGSSTTDEGEVLDVDKQLELALARGEEIASEKRRKSIAEMTEEEWRDYLEEHLENLREDEDEEA